MALGTYALLRPGQSPIARCCRKPPTDAGEHGRDARGGRDGAGRPPTRPVEIIEYASFTCPHCATLPREHPAPAQGRITSTRDRFGWSTARSISIGPAFGQAWWRVGAGPMRYFGDGDANLRNDRPMVQGARPRSREACAGSGSARRGMNERTLDRPCLTDAAKWRPAPLIATAATSTENPAAGREGMPARPHRGTCTRRHFAHCERAAERPRDDRIVPAPEGIFRPSSAMDASRGRAAGGMTPRRHSRLGGRPRL